MIATAACKIFFHSFAILGKTISVLSKLGEKYFFPSQLMVLGCFFLRWLFPKVYILCITNHLPFLLKQNASMIKDKSNAV